MDSDTSTRNVFAILSLICIGFAAAPLIMWPLAKAAYRSPCCCGRLHCGGGRRGRARCCDRRNNRRCCRCRHRRCRGHHDAIRKPIPIDPLILGPSNSPDSPSNSPSRDPGPSNGVVRPIHLDVDENGLIQRNSPNNSPSASPNHNPGPSAAEPSNSPRAEIPRPDAQQQHRRSVSAPPSRGFGEFVGDYIADADDELPAAAAARRAERAPLCTQPLVRRHGASVALPMLIIASVLLLFSARGVPGQVSITRAVSWVHSK